LADRVRDERQQKTLIAEMKAMLKERSRKDYGYVTIAEYKRDSSVNGLSVPAAAKKVFGKQSLDDQIKLVLTIQTNGGASAVFHGMSEDDLQHFLKHPNTMIASDSGVRKWQSGVPHPRGYGNNARLLEHYVRELHLLPLEDALIKLGHTGSIDVSAIIDEDGNPWPLEFTARPGWPSFNVVQCLHEEPVEWMIDLINGHDSFRPATDVAVGVVCAIPDYPVSHFTKKEVSGIPLYNVNDDNQYRPYLSVCEVMSGSAPDEVDGQIEDKRMMVSCGDYLVVATGLGENVRDAQKEAYAAIESLEIPNNMIVRTDIGDSLKKDLPKLHDLGYATDMVW